MACYIEYAVDYWFIDCIGATELSPQEQHQGIMYLVSELSQENLGCVCTETVC